MLFRKPLNTAVPNSKLVCIQFCFYFKNKRRFLTNSVRVKNYLQLVSCHKMKSRPTRPKHFQPCGCNVLYDVGNCAILYALQSSITVNRYLWEKAKMWNQLSKPKTHSGMTENVVTPLHSIVFIDTFVLGHFGHFWRMSRCFCAQAAYSPWLSPLSHFSISDTCSLDGNFLTALSEQHCLCNKRILGRHERRAM